MNFKWFSILITMLTYQGCMAQNNPKLIYVGDPMCSWCYGISEELKEVKNHYDGTLDFEMVMGGLRPYNTETMTDLKDFLTHHWEDVSVASGQQFTYDILDNGHITYDTEPPCRASVVVRSIDVSKEFHFFKAVQKAFYKENKNLHELESYHPILEQLGVDVKMFDEKFNSSEYKELVQKDFKRSEELGVRSFPTLLLVTEGQTYVIAQGFATAENMMNEIEKRLSKK